MPRPASTLLDRNHHNPRPALEVVPEMSFTLARAHELCGSARRTLALMIAARTSGPILWIHPSWVPDRINPDGARRWIDPGRLIWAKCKRQEDILWSMEEALRSGAVPIVVAEATVPPALTPVRRLHLASETGAEEGKFAPLGLILSSGDGGAAGVESRWHLAAHHTASAEGWLLSRRRARNAPPKEWRLTQEHNGITLTRPEKSA